MKQRVITGLGLGIFLLVLLYFGGAVLGVAAMVCICFAVYEEYHALSLAGHRPIAWPTWSCMALSVPMVVLLGTSAMIPLMMLACLATATWITFRTEPKVEDILVSVMPLFTVALPGLCIVALAMVQPKALQLVLLGLMFFIPVFGDMTAFFVGSRVGGRKLCPAVSPNKTISGALGGLLGSLLAAMVVGLVGFLCCDEATRTLLPGWGTYVILGLVGGAASQMGDLFASLVKRHCGIKDFSNLFPGHGGMLDRLDSILFMAIIMFCYRLLTTAGVA